MLSLLAISLSPWYKSQNLGSTEGVVLSLEASIPGTYPDNKFLMIPEAGICEPDGFHVHHSAHGPMSPLSASPGPWSCCSSSSLCSSWMSWDSGLGCLPPHCHSWGSSQGQDLQFYVAGEDTFSLEGCSRCLCSGRSRKVLSHLNWILPFLPESQPASAFPAIEEPDFPAGMSLQWGCLAE